MLEKQVNLRTRRVMIVIVDGMGGDAGLGHCQGEW
jgi:hypothetical protein